MPELPEVETVKNTLKQNLQGKKILKVDVYWDSIIESPSVSLFVQNIKNQTIQDMSRRGKWLLFELDDYVLLSHLRMEGKYFFKSTNDIRDKHQHVVFTLDDGTELRYHDTRKFGKMHLIKKERVFLENPLLSLGLEPFDPLLTVDYLRNHLKNKSLPIKACLLDQSIITGIGNIYADEILFLSHINPKKKGKNVQLFELESLIKNTVKVLNAAILQGGTTIRSYTSSEGVTGLFQTELYVHTKKGKPCPICDKLIVKIVVSGRGTYFCPNCQK